MPKRASGAEVAEKEPPAESAPDAAAAPVEAPSIVAVVESDAGVEPADASQAVAVTDAAPPPVIAAPAADARHDIVVQLKTPTGPAKYAVAYLEDGPKEPSRGMKLTIDQRMMMFLPHVSAIAAGGTVTFLNSDPFPHNVFSPNGERFDLGMLNKGGVGRYTFRRTGAYSILCNVHPGMLAYIYVAPSSYFGVSDARGKLTMKSVPDGTYKIAAWAPKMAAAAQTVTVSGADATVELELQKQ